MPKSNVQKEQWLLCPVCASKTRIKLTFQTVLQSFPLFCPKCKAETPINVEKKVLRILAYYQIPWTEEPFTYL